MNKHTEKMKHREAVKAALQALSDFHEGKLTPEIVYRAALDPESPLHKEFEWDLQKAAKEHWLNTARKLIQSVRVEIRTEKITVKVPAYLRDTEVEPYEQGYTTLAVAKSDEDRKRDVLLHELMRLRGYIERVRGIAMAFGLQNAVDSMLHEIDRMIVFGETQAPETRQ